MSNPEEPTRPRVAFVGLTMKLFWSLYPGLEPRTLERQERILGHLREHMDVIATDLAGDAIGAEHAIDQLAAADFDLLVLWANGYVTSDFGARIIDQLNRPPVVLLITQRDASVPAGMTYERYMENTALTSLTELGGALRKLSIPFTPLVGQDDDPELYVRLATEAKAMCVARRIRNLKIGSIGFPYPGMLDITVDERAINALGASVIRFSLSEMTDRLRAVPERRVHDFIAATRYLYDATHVAEEDVFRVNRVYCMLETLVREQGLGALCVHDYDCLSTVTRTISDFALSLLENQHGIRSGVEGDLPNTLSAWLLSSLTGSSSMFVDWTLFDAERNAVFFQHNGKADPAMLIRPVLRPTAEPFGIEGAGAVFEAAGKPGPVTMLSLISDGLGWRMFVAEGEALAADTSPCQLNQFTVRMAGSVRDILEQVCGLGISHHVNISHGHVLPAARLLARRLSVDLLTL